MVTRYNFFAFNDVTFKIDLRYSETIPFILFFMYQMMFAIITAPLMTGAFANRLTVSGWIKILILWMIFDLFSSCALGMGLEDF